MASDLQREQQKYRHNLGMLCMCRQNLIAASREYPDLQFELHQAAAKVEHTIGRMKTIYEIRKAKIIEKRGYGVQK